MTNTFFSYGIDGVIVYFVFFFFTYLSVIG